VADPLRADWDFDDLDGTEQRFQRLLAADAAHMAALVAADRAGFVAWTERGIELAEANDDARY
jgi:hypothetical protein